MATSGCDIIIPIWNQLEYTKKCIEAIKANTDYPYRLILIDNASEDSARIYLENLKETRCDVILIRNEENLGFVKAVNQGLKISSAPYVCVLNNDTIPAPGWLNAMVDFAENHPNAGLINPLCNGHGEMTLSDYAKSLAGNRGVYMEMNQCQGFAMLMKREVLTNIGYLDESFGIGGYDDTDYSMRAHLAGYKSVAVYDSYVYHRLHASFDKAGNRESWVKRNRKIYYDKWGRHLRVGFIIKSGNDNGVLSDRLVKFAYGLAREWTWVHVMINADSISAARRLIEKAVKDNNYPLHQNIRIKYHALPNLIFEAMVLIKILERRLNPRFRDKRFDAVLTLRDLCGDNDNWEQRGRDYALKLKDKFNIKKNV
jgi:GT2 family glycosyltransferase